MFDQISKWILQPWPWYISGPLIGLMVPALLLFGNKQFGISSSLKHACSVLPIQNDYFKFDWKKNGWNLFYILGILMGAFLASHFLSESHQVAISEATVADLKGFGFSNFEGYLPIELYNWQNLFKPAGWLLLVGGGILIGFGTRYAGGCTSGHAITGLSLLSPASLIAVIGFFIGGLLATHVLYPLIF